MAVPTSPASSRTPQPLALAVAIHTRRPELGLLPSPEAQARESAQWLSVAPAQPAEIRPALSGLSLLSAYRTSRLLGSALELVVRNSKPSLHLDALLAANVVTTFLVSWVSLQWTLSY